jgi:Sigma-70, region 4
VEGQGTASGPGRQLDVASVMAMVAATASVPGRLPADDSGSQVPEQQLRAIAESLTPAGNRSASAGSKYEPRGRALVFRLWPARSLHVVGDSPLAAEFRRLLAAGAAPGWDLHPAPAGRTPLSVLAGPLHRLSGSVRFYNLLDREGFAFVEEVAATPDGCLLELRNSGMKFITAVRQVLADRGFGGAPAETGSLRAPGDPGRDPADPAGDGEVLAEVAAALQVVAAWAVAEHGAQVLGDMLTLAPGVTDLPPDVAASWDRVRQLGLRPAEGTELANRDLAQLAKDLLGELEERRRLILTSRTFAPGRRTYGSLAAELGVSSGRVRQLETSALQQLAYAAAHDQYRPLRWRAASAAQPGSTRVVPIPGAPTWTDRMLTWLAGKTNAADG